MKNNDNVVTKSTINDHFIIDHCITGHCVQGSTINQAYTIFEWQKVSREWFYVALTRCRRFSDVTFYDGEEIEIVSDDVKLCQSKVMNYKLQDRKKDRIICEKKYIDANWIIKQTMRLLSRAQQTDLRICNDIHREFVH